MYGRGASGELLHHSPRYHKIYTAIVFICVIFLTFGNYWVFDTPGAIQSQLTEWFGPSYTQLRNDALYSIYSWPNTVLAFFGGVIVDKVGVRVGVVLFAGLIFLGHSLFALGVQFKLYGLALAGRGVFGLGGESLTVAQNTFTVRWFSGPKIALVFGLVVAFSRVGSAVNFAVTPPLANDGVPLSIWLGAGFCALSWLMAVLGALLDYNAGEVLREKFASRPEPPSEAPMKLKDILLFPLSAWLLFLVCLFFYVSILTFYVVASDIMQHTGHRFAPTRASLFLFIPNALSIFLAPTFGYVIDRSGRALTWILVGCVAVAITHLAFLSNANEWYLIHPIPLMLILGLGYSIGASAMWPIVPFIVPDQLVSTAYGTMTAIQNLGMAVMPLAIGLAQQEAPKRWTYTIPIVMFLGTITTAFVLTVILIGIDKAAGSPLNSSAAERQAKKEGRGEPFINAGGYVVVESNSKSDAMSVPSRDADEKLISPEHLSVNDGGRRSSRSVTR